MPIYYKIDPASRFIKSDFKFKQGNLEKIDLFYKLKKDSENLYKGFINDSFYSKNSFTKDISTYLQQRKFLQDFSIENPPLPHEYRFPKCCWLADNLLSNGFENPLVAHYNPRLREHVVHPGAGRIVISQLFQTTPIECLYFNTGGIQFDWLDRFTILDKDQLLQINFSLFSLVADHGSMIPHIYFKNQIENYENIFRYHKFVKSRLADPKFQIKSNMNIEPLNHWLTDLNYAPIEIVVKTKKCSDDDIMRSCILAVLGRAWDSDTLEVKINTV
jgi:hypothetical protein